jgi:hypothetical protein
LLKTQAYAVKAAYTSAFDMVQVIERDDWCCIYARRSASVFTQCSKCETVFKLSAEVLRAAAARCAAEMRRSIQRLARLAEDSSAFKKGESPLDLETRADRILESVTVLKVAHAVAKDYEEYAPPGSRSRISKFWTGADEDPPDHQETDVRVRDVRDALAKSGIHRMHPGDLDRQAPRSRRTS